MARAYGGEHNRLDTLSGVTWDFLEWAFLVSTAECPKNFAEKSDGLTRVLPRPHLEHGPEKHTRRVISWRLFY